MGYHVRGKFPKVPGNTLNHLHAPFSREEIKDAIFSMGALKAPGPDGLNPIFFQSQWEVVGNSVGDLLQECYHNPAMIKEINDTLIVLISKLDRPSFLTHYRPINLGNVIYKAMTKVIATRLKEVMGTWVAPTQCSFIKGRESTDNIIIAQEVFHSMRGRKGWVAMEIDLEKAYDRLSWSFLFDTLVDLGFENSFCNLILSCVS